MDWVMGYKKRLGGWGETIAAEYLAGNGYVILERNFRTQYGEIDLITLDKEILVFVEVKTRTSRKFGYPEEAISPKKNEHLLASAQAYIQTHQEMERDWRIDVIAIERIERNSLPEITQFENIITDTG
jgi:putative endonuclease